MKYINCKFCYNEITQQNNDQENEGVIYPICSMFYTWKKFEEIEKKQEETRRKHRSKLNLDKI